MPTPDSPEPREPLDPLLDQWGRETPSAPRPLAPEVWRRIAEGEKAAAATGWLGQLNAVFGRASFATAFVAACVLLGLFLAEARSSRLQAEHGAQLAQSYLQLIDPLLAKPARPAAPQP
jgi:hypothetical protein